MARVIAVTGTQVILIAETHLKAIVNNRSSVDLLFKLKGSHECLEKGVGGDSQSGRSGQPLLYAAKTHVGADIGHYGSYSQPFSLILYTYIHSERGGVEIVKLLVYELTTQPEGDVVAGSYSNREGAAPVIGGNLSGGHSIYVVAVNLSVIEKRLPRRPERFCH